MDLIEAMQHLQQGAVENVPSELLFPLLRWSSGSKNNLKASNRINKLFFFVKANVLIKMLALTTKGYSKYPKPAKEVDAKYDVIAGYLCKYYKWSKNELQKNRRVVKLLTQDKAFVEWLNRIVGFESGECKKVGVEFKAVEKESRMVGVFDFA